MNAEIDTAVPSPAAPIDPSLQPGERAPGVLLPALLAGVLIIVAAVHWPVLSAKALSFDDDQFLIYNQLVQNPSWHSVGRFFGEILHPSTVGGYSVPVTMVSLMLDWARGGRIENLAPFHQTNLVLHLLSTLLIGVLMHRLFRRVWVSAAVALIFGLHPMTVESLAWVSERKTLLASMFAFASLLSYVKYAKCRSSLSLMGALLWYVLAVLSKPTTLPLPLAMLALDFWPLERLSVKAVVEKWPLYVAMIASAVVTVVSNTAAGDVTVGQGGIGRIVLTIGYLVPFYLGKIVFPRQLTSVYPLPEPLTVANGAVSMSLLMLAAFIVIGFMSLRRTRAAAAGLGMFLLLLFPTLGVVGYSWVTASDKYVYLPMVGLLLILAYFLQEYGLPSIPGGLATPGPGWIAAVIAIAALEAVGTRHYLTKWRDTETLAHHMVHFAPQHPEPHLYLAQHLFGTNRPQEGLRQAEAAVKVQPTYPKAQLGMGNALLTLGAAAQAVPFYEEAIRLKPGYATPHLNLGLAYLSSNRPGMAAEALKKAVELAPTNVAAHVLLSKALAAGGDLAGARDELAAARKLDPFAKELEDLEGVLNDAARVIAAHAGLNPPDAFIAEAEALARKGDLAGAIAQCRAAIAILPQHADAHASLCALLLNQPDLNEMTLGEALGHGLQAVRARPDNVEARINFAAALLRARQGAAAIHEFQEAVRLAPQNVGIRMNLATLLEAAGKPAEAREQYQAIQAIAPDTPGVQERLNRLSAAGASPAPASAPGR